MVITNLDYFRDGDHFPRGGTLNFYTNVDAYHFFVQNFEFQYFWGFSERIFLCNEDFLDIF